MALDYIFKFSYRLNQQSKGVEILLKFVQISKVFEFS